MLKPHQFRKYVRVLKGYDINSNYFIYRADVRLGPFEQIGTSQWVCSQRISEKHRVENLVNRLYKFAVRKDPVKVKRGWLIKPKAQNGMVNL